MIKTRKQLQEVLSYEMDIYKKLGYKGRIHAYLSLCEVGYIYRYIEALRKDEYYTNNKGIIYNIIGMYWKRKHNYLGVQLGISIPVNAFDKGLKIYHSQGIIVHKDARIGKNCSLHGMNCIGNRGVETGEINTPVIGDSCDIGVGASLIGGIKIGNNIKVAAGAVVCKDCVKDGAVLIGIPARGEVKC